MDYQEMVKASTFRPPVLGAKQIEAEPQQREKNKSRGI
jgi:hypothetical protein